MSKRYRDGRVKPFSLFHLNIVNLNSLDDNAENLLLNLLGIVEAVELSQMDGIDLMILLEILGKYRDSGNKYLPDWIRFDGGELVDWSIFPWESLNNMVRNDGKWRKDISVCQYYLTEIGRCNRFFNFYFILPKTFPECDIIRWKKFCCAIILLYNGLKRKLCYPMDFFSVKTVSDYLLKKGNIHLYPEDKIIDVYNFILWKFDTGCNYQKKEIIIPNYSIPYIESHRRENIDEQLCNLRKVIWVNKLNIGCGNNEFSDNTFMYCINYLVRLLVGKYNRLWMDNVVLKNDHRFLKNWELLEIVGNCLTLHFLHFSKL